MAPRQKPIADIEAAEVRRTLKNTQALFSTVEQWPTLGVTLKKSPEAVNYLMSHDKDARKVARAFLAVVSAVLSLEAVLREVVVPETGAGSAEAPEPEEELWPIAQPIAPGKKAKAKGSAKPKSDPGTGPKAGNFFAAIWEAVDGTSTSLKQDLRPIPLVYKALGRLFFRTFPKVFAYGFLLGGLGFGVMAVTHPKHFIKFVLAQAGKVPAHLLWAGREMAEELWN